MKKTLAIMLALVMVVAFAGCNVTTADPGDTTTDGTIGSGTQMGDAMENAGDDIRDTIDGNRDYNTNGLTDSSRNRNNNNYTNSNTTNSYGRYSYGGTNGNMNNPTKTPNGTGTTGGSNLNTAGR